MEYLKNRNINDNLGSIESGIKTVILNRDLYTFNQDIKNELKESYGFIVDFEEADQDDDWSRRWFCLTFRKKPSCYNFDELSYLDCSPADKLNESIDKEYMIIIKSIANEIATYDYLEIYETNTNYIIADTLAIPRTVCIDPVSFSPVVMFMAKLKRNKPVD